MRSMPTRRSSPPPSRRTPTRPRTTTSADSCTPASPTSSESSHFAEHVRPPGLQETDDQRRGEKQEGNVQERGVVPGERGFDDLRPPMLRNDAKRLEAELDRERGEHHRGVEDAGDRGHHLPIVVPAIDVQDRQHDQIGEEEADHAAEADAAVRETGSKRDVTDRADERQYGDDGADQRSPQL